MVAVDAFAGVVIDKVGQNGRIIFFPAPRIEESKGLLQFLDISAARYDRRYPRHVKDEQVATLHDALKKNLDAVAGRP